MIGLDDELTMITDGGKEPTWMWTSAAYIRSFSRCRRVVTRDSMPSDRRLSKAVRTVYRASGTADRAVMTGTFKGSRQEQKHRFSRLCCLLAVQAGLCTACIVPATWEETISGDDPEQKKGDINHELS